MNQLNARKETGSRLSSVELSLIVVVIVAPDPTQLNQLSCVELSRIGRYDQGFTAKNNLIFVHLLGSSIVFLC